MARDPMRVRRPFAGRGKRAVHARGAVLAAALLALTAGPALAQFQEYRQRDRGGAGVPSSQFATFAEKGDLFVYPYYEYYWNHAGEYQPSELGYEGEADYFGAYSAHEALIFLGYGVSDRLFLEMEAAWITARQRKGDGDPTSFPAELEASGVGDVEAQLRYRWREETVEAAEVFSYFETVFPLQEKNSLIGTSSWEFKYGMGLARSRSWGTTILRASIGFADGTPELGEYAVEYVRGLGERLRLYGAVEGTQDEVELITEAQLFLARNVKLKLNSAFGLTKKAPDWAPEVGVMFVF